MVTTRARKAYIACKTEPVGQNAAIPMLTKTQSYTYLGYDINLSATAEDEQVGKIVSDFKTTLATIEVAPFPVAAKLQAVNITATSKLHFFFQNIVFTEKALDSPEDSIVFYVRSWFDLNNSSTLTCLFCPPPPPPPK